MNMIASFYFALQVCPNLTLMHLQRWHDTVIHQPRFEAVYHPEAFKEDLISHKDQSSKKTAASAITSTKKATEKAAPKLKLKILCLHGYRQTSTTFYEKTGAFRKMVGKLCDLVLIDAPHLVPPEAHGLSASEVTEEQRGWWFSQPHGYFKVCMFTCI